MLKSLIWTKKHNLIVSLQKSPFMKKAYVGQVNYSF